PRHDVDVDALAFKMLIDGLPVGREVLVIDEIPTDLPIEMLANGASDWLERMAIKSLVIIRTTISDDSAPLTCAVVVGTVTERRSWAPEVVRDLELVTQIMALALHSRRRGHLLSASRAEIE